MAFVLSLKICGQLHKLVVQLSFNNYPVKLHGISSDTYTVAEEAVGKVGYNQAIFGKIEQDNCFII